MADAAAVVAAREGREGREHGKAGRRMSRRASLNTSSAGAATKAVSGIVTYIVRHLTLCALLYGRAVLGA